MKFERICEIAREFPDLQESTMYGAPSIQLGKRLVICVASHRSAEPGSLVLRTNWEQRPGLLADDPSTFYLTEHYRNHPVVLVRPDRLRDEQIRDLLVAARLCVLSHRPPAKRMTY